MPAHDLAAILAELDARYFKGAVRARIAWGRSSRLRRPRRTIGLAWYAHEAATIRVHPALGEQWVPRWVVAYVVWHEVLHSLLAYRERHGRRRLHPPEFLALEALHPDAVRAEAWVDRHLDRLLAYGVREAAP